MAEKQILALSGKSRGVLRLEYGKKLGYAVESPSYLKDAELWLLFSDEEWSILPGCSGECPLPQRRVRAAAVAREGAFVMAGGRADFAAAKSACFTRREKARLRALEVQAVARASAQRAAQAVEQQQTAAPEGEQEPAAVQEPQIAAQEGEWKQTRATWERRQEQTAAQATVQGRRQEQTVAQATVQEREPKQTRAAREERQEQAVGRERSGRAAAQERIRAAGGRVQEQAWAEAAQREQTGASMHKAEAKQAAQEARTATRRAEEQAVTARKAQEQAQTFWKKASIPRPAEPMRVQMERGEDAFSLPVPEVVSAPALRELRWAAEPERSEERRKEAAEPERVGTREQSNIPREQHKVESPAEPRVRRAEREAGGSVEPRTHWEEREAGNLAEPSIPWEQHKAESSAEPRAYWEERETGSLAESRVRQGGRMAISAERAPTEQKFMEVQGDQPVKPPSARSGLFPALEEAEEREPQKSRPQRAAEQSEEAPRTRRCFERKESQIAPFPKIFPSSHWKKIEYPAYPGRGHYLMGEIYQGQACTAKALAVPGRYALNPPAWLKGFETYLEDSEGQGYWLLFQDEAGKALPIAQVFRDLQEEC